MHSIDQQQYRDTVGGRNRRDVPVIALRPTTIEAVRTDESLRCEIVDTWLEIVAAFGMADAIVTALTARPAGHKFPNGNGVRPRPDGSHYQSCGCLPCNFERSGRPYGDPTVGRGPFVTASGIASDVTVAHLVSDGFVVSWLRRHANLSGLTERQVGIRSTFVPNLTGVIRRKDANLSHNATRHDGTVPVAHVPTIEWAVDPRAVPAPVIL